MNLTVAICTYNRCESLRLTLASLARVRVPEGAGCELIVVDNASTDRTAEVVRSCTLPDMPIRYVHEPRRGQSHARNTAIRAAGGGVILFTDDDVRPPHDWLEGMCAPIITGKAHAVAGGVKIAPHLERPWMGRLHKIWLASTEFYDRGNPSAMIGANMAFSTEVLAKVSGFDTELGPGAVGFHDETLFSWQLKEAGYRLVSAFDVAVEHHFDESRLLRSSFLDTARKKGHANAYVWHHWQHRTIPSPRRQLAKNFLRLVKWRTKEWPKWLGAEGMPEWEMTVVTDFHFNKHYLAERERPRNYHKHGLAKLTHNSASLN